MTEHAKQAEKNGDTTEAIDYYLYGNTHKVNKAAAKLFPRRRAAVIYRIARFPVIDSPTRELAWSLGKEAFLKGTK